MNPFADKGVRKAIAYAIDKEETDRVQYGGLADPATGPLTRFLEPFHNPNTQPQYPRDVARANQLLTDAGFPRDPNSGVRFLITFIYDPGFEAAAPKTPYYFGRTCTPSRPRPRLRSPRAAAADTAACGRAAPGSARTWPPADRSLRGTSVWSVREGGRYFLVADRGGAVRRLAIASRGVPFDVDLGPDEDGDVVAVYSRCEKEPRVPAITGRLYSTPVAAYATGRGCDLYRYDFASGQERKLPGASTDQASEFLPSIWRDGRVTYGFLANLESEEGPKSVASVLLRYRISSADKSVANPPGTVLASSAVDGQQLLIHAPDRFGPAPFGQLLRPTNTSFVD